MSTGRVREREGRETRDSNKEREHKLNGTWSNLKPIEKSCGCRTTTLLPKTNVTKAKTGAQLPGPS